MVNLGADSEFALPTLQAVLGVAIPFFENTDYLQEVVASLWEQDCDEWVGVVVDDSPEGIPGAVLSSILSDRRLTVFRNTYNIGPARAWNLGVAKVVQYGVEVVAVVHADDRLASRYVRETLAAHRAEPDPVAIHWAVSTIDASGRRTIHLRDFAKRLLQLGSGSVVSEGDSGLARILAGNFVFCPALTFKADMIKQPLFAEHLSQTMDLELLADLLLSGNRIVGRRERLYYYRRHGESLTLRNERSGARFEEEAETYARIARRARDAGFVRSARVAARMTVVVLHCLYLTGRALTMGRLEVHRGLRSEFRKVITIRACSVHDLRQSLPGN